MWPTQGKVNAKRLPAPRTCHATQAQMCPKYTGRKMYSSSYSLVNDYPISFWIENVYLWFFLGVALYFMHAGASSKSRLLHLLLLLLNFQRPLQSIKISGKNVACEKFNNHRMPTWVFLLFHYCIATFLRWLLLCEIKARQQQLATSNSSSRCSSSNMQQHHQRHRSSSNTKATLATNRWRKMCAL